MAQDVTVRYEFPPPEDSSVAFGLDAIQLGIVVSTLLVVITATRFGAPLWLLVAVAAPVVAAGIARWRGERLPTLAARWVAWGLRPRRSRRAPVTATAVLPASGFDGADGGEVQRVVVEPPGWAKGVELVEAPYGDGGQTVGVWRDGDGWATVLAVRAPATALRDLDEQASFLSGWGDLLSSAGAEGSPVQRVAWVARTAPDQGAGAAGWLRDQADGTVRLAQPSIWRSYMEVGEAAGSAAAARELLLVVRVQPDRARHRLRGVRGREARRAAEAQLAIAETERIGVRLVELGCQIEGLYTPEAVAGVVRTTCDPSAREDLAWWQAAAGDGGGVSPVSGMWPTSYEEAADHVRVDAGYHRLAWVEEWPTVPVLATWMHPLLLRSSVTRTVAMVMEPVATHTAARAARRARAAAVSEADVRARHGFVADARSGRQLEAAEQREQELIDGHRDMRFAAFVCVTARSLGELEEAWATTVYEAGQSRLRLRALHGEHWPALSAVLPLGRFF